MQKNKLKFAGYLTISIILTLGLSISMQSLLAAWTAPTQNPPGGNPDKPIDESAVGQTKLGNLSVGGNFYVGDGGTNDVLFVDNANGKVGIGTTTPGYNLDVLGSARITGDLHGINYIYGDFGTIARSTDEWLRLNDGSTHANGVYIPNKLRADGGLYVSDDEYFYRNSEDFIRTGDHFQSDASVRAPIFYDSNNTGYYVNPAGTSKFNTINLGGVSRNSWPSGGGAWSSQHNSCYTLYTGAACTWYNCAAGYVVVGVYPCSGGWGTLRAVRCCKIK